MKDIKGYEGLYAVTSCGRVWSYKSKKFLKPFVTKEGYLRISLRKDYKKSNYRIHRLVAEAYIPNPNNLPQVDHIDFDRSNNNVNNLQWISSNDNLSKRRNIKTIKCLENNKIYKSINEAARDLKLDPGSISHVIHGDMKQTGGYHFEIVGQGA